MVDPWGAIIAQCSEGTNIAIAEIDHELLQKTRLSMPVLEHRRSDVYPAMECLESIEVPLGEELSSKSFQFGQVSVNGSGIFLKSGLSMAFTNKKCVVPGRILYYAGFIPFAMKQYFLARPSILFLFIFIHKLIPYLCSDVLVAPFRCVPRMNQLSSVEVSDLFSLVHKIAPVVERVYAGSSTTIVVQDGKDAGQTIEVCGHYHFTVYLLTYRLEK